MGWEVEARSRRIEEAGGMKHRMFSDPAKVAWRREQLAILRARHSR